MYYYIIRNIINNNDDDDNTQRQSCNSSRSSWNMKSNRKYHRFLVCLFLFVSFHHAPKLSVLGFNVHVADPWKSINNSHKIINFLNKDPKKLCITSKLMAQANDSEWKFFDTARLNVSGGDGGKGCVAMLRLKGEPLGGPAGGRGGKGGDIWLVCDESLNTLAPVRNKVHVRGGHGRGGLGKSKDGSAGKDVFVRVPPGTMVRELQTQKFAGELRHDGDKLLVAKGGRGGRGNAAFMTPRNTAPKFAERGEPGASRWISIELRLVADVGFLGMPNAGKSTLLAAASAARPKIANYPFTTIIPNLGVCDIGEEGAGLVLCDIPGLIEGASEGTGLGHAFLRHVQRCKVLLHVVDGSSEDPVGDFITINNELRKYDEFLGNKPQVVILNKVDITEVNDIKDDLIKKLRKVAGHSRILPISGVTKEGVKELMGRLKKFVQAQPDVDLPPLAEIEFTKGALEVDSDDFDIMSDPAYPGQWRVMGSYIEQIAKMTHWEYPEAVERFGRQLEALGISAELEARGGQDGDLVMIGEYDFDFSPGLTNPYIPQELLDKDLEFESDASGYRNEDRALLISGDDETDYINDDEIEMREFEDNDWESFFEDEDGDFDFTITEDDEIWTST